MNKQFNKKMLAPLFLVATLVFGTLFGSVAPTSSVKAAKATDPWNNPVMTLGVSLSKKQKNGTINTLQDQIHGHDFQELTVNGDTLVKYLNPSGANFNSDSKVYSSALISKKKTGGINVEIIKYNGKNNITTITANEYKNAALTAGIENANIYVTSAVKIDGSGALAGIYAAYDKNGKSLDQDRINAAQDELNVLSDINQADKDKDGFSDDQLCNAIAGAKVDMANEGGNLSRSQITTIVNNQLNENNLTSVITSSQKKQIINLLVKIQNSGATTSNGFKGQAKKVSHSISNPVSKASNAVQGETKAKKHQAQKNNNQNNNNNQANNSNNSQNKNFLQQMWYGIVAFFSNIGNQISNWINGNNNNSNKNNDDNDNNDNSDNKTQKPKKSNDDDNSDSNSDSSDSSSSDSSDSSSDSSSSSSDSNSNSKKDNSNSNSSSQQSGSNSQVQSQSN